MGRRQFASIARSKSEAVLASLGGTLRSTYQFSGREESQEVPGAYTLRFASVSAIPSLWVNLAARDKPILILTVLNPQIQANVSAGR